MEPETLRLVLDTLGISQRDTARRLEVDERTVRRWVAGDSVIPGPVVACLREWVRHDIRKLRGLEARLDRQSPEDLPEPYRLFWERHGTRRKEGSAGDRRGPSLDDEAKWEGFEQALRTLRDFLREHRG